MANCTNCGKPLEKGVKFCVSCGTAVTDAPTEATPAPAKQKKTAVTDAPTEAMPAPVKQKKTAANCENCGKPLEKGVKFCVSCGTPVGDDPVAPAPQWSATPPTAEQTAVMSTGRWLLTLIVYAIPIVGLIMAFVWAFGSGGNLNRRNFCRASLILMLVGLVLGLVYTFMFSSTLAVLLNQ